MDGLIGFILEMLFEVFGELVVEGLFYLVFEYPFERWHQLEDIGPELAKYRARFVVGWYLAVGSAMGFLFSFVVRRRMIHQVWVPGSSVVVVPLLVGMLMRYLGRIREAGERSPIFTFWGGWAFAFGVALVRFLMVR